MHRTPRLRIGRTKRSRRAGGGVQVRTVRVYAPQLGINAGRRVHYVIHYEYTQHVNGVLLNGTTVKSYTGLGMRELRNSH